MTIASRFRAGAYEIDLVSINFHGARVRVSLVDLESNDGPYCLVFSSRERKQALLVDREMESFVSFHDFGFSGFHPEEVHVSLIRLDPNDVIFTERCVLRCLPHVAFYRDASPDHHMGFFFRLYRPDLVSYGDAGATYPDRGVFLLSADVDQSLLPNQVRQLPASALSKLSAGNALLLIDQSHEGNPFNGEFATLLHQALSDLSIRADQVFFVNHTHKYREKYTEWADRLQLDDRINIFYANWYADGYFRTHSEFFASHGGIDQYVENQRYRAFSDTIRPRRYLSLNYTARPHRVLLMLEFMQRGMLDAGYVSFGGTRNSDQYKQNFYDMNGEGFIRHVGRPELLQLLPALDEMGAWTLDQSFRSGVEGEAIRMSATSPDEYFHDSYFSIVSESEFSSSDFMRVTEKAFKPLMRLHPSLFVGNYNTLGLLEDMGYKRFPEFFDNTYDGVEDARERHHLIIKELDRLNALSDQEIADNYRASWPVLEHNLYTGHAYIEHGIKDRSSVILNAMLERLRR